MTKGFRIFRWRLQKAYNTRQQRLHNRVGML
jgi:hypothetical protein